MENDNLLTAARNKHRRLSTLALANVIVMAGSARAADASADAPTGAANPAPKTQPKAAATSTKSDTTAASSTTLNEVVVTAKQESAYQTQTSGNGKYTEPLLNTPQTITIIPQQLMKDQNATSLQQALQNVPGITFGAGEGGTLPGDNFTIRGFNAQQDIFIDGYRDTGIYKRDPFNVEQIEVVEGPASAYTGYGSTGGSVNLVTKTPNLKPSYEFDSGYGTNQYYRETLDINQPLGDDVLPSASFRLNGIYQYNEFSERDYIYNSRWGAFPEFTYGLGTDTRITLSYLYLQEQDLPTFGVPLVNATGAAANPGLASGVNHVAPVDYSNFYGFVNRDYMNTTTHMPTLTFEHDFDPDVKLVNLTRYAQTYLDEITTPPRFDTGLNYNPDGSLAGNFTAATYPADTMTRELRGRRQVDTVYGNQSILTASFNTWAIKHDFVASAEVDLQSENTRTASGNNIVNNLGNPQGLDPYPFPITWGAETRTNLNDYAFSVFDSMTITPKWILSGGMRFDHIDATAHNPATTTTGAYTAQQTNDLASWRSALTYKPTEDSSIYFGYGTSYNPSVQGATSDSSSPQGLTGPTANLDPEKDESYEFGGKWNVLHDKLSLTTDFFRTIKDNTRIADPNNPGQYLLAGRTRVQGIQVGAEGNLTKEWKVFGGYTYLQSEILSSVTPGATGNQLPFTPNQSGSLWTTYELPAHLTIGTGVQISDKQFGSTANTTSVPGNVTQQAMLSYAPTKNVSFQLNVYNLWDEHYIAVYGNGGAVPGPGRSITFTTSLKF